LARQGVKVGVLEQARLGWGASGRNGGQVHVGLRRNQHWIERRLGRDAARCLWDVGLRAREHLDWLVETYSIKCDLRHGLLHADHKSRYGDHSRRYVDYLDREYDYKSLRYVGLEEIRSAVASNSYVGGTLDTRGGHLHALNFALGIGRAAHQHGAKLHEDTEVTGIQRVGSAWRLTTPRGAVRAQQVILACNGYLRGISPIVEAHVMPINNFIAVTEPMKPETAAALVRNGCAVADSRFVVYYFRITADHRLLFGGGENYSYRFPDDIGAYVRKHIVRIFPQLAPVRLDYAWGGTLAITSTRMPFIRELEPGLFNASGFSGKGVVFAPYAGRVVAQAIMGDRADFELLGRVPVPRFPGGARLRGPTLFAAMSIAALLDRI
jgi:gamma-glutamylputrescine oxidase